MGFNSVFKGLNKSSSERFSAKSTLHFHVYEIQKKKYVKHVFQVVRDFVGQVYLDFRKVNCWTHIFFLLGKFPRKQQLPLRSDRTF